MRNIEHLTTGVSAINGDGIDDTEFSYLVSTSFSALDEYEINPLDQKIGINWGLTSELMKISEKDRMAPTLSEQFSRGKLPS